MTWIRSKTVQSRTSLVVLMGLLTALWPAQSVVASDQSFDSFGEEIAGQLLDCWSESSDRQVISLHDVAEVLEDCLSDRGASSDGMVDLRDVSVRLYLVSQWIQEMLGSTTWRGTIPNKPLAPINPANGNTFFALPISEAASQPSGYFNLAPAEQAIDQEYLLRISSAASPQGP